KMKKIILLILIWLYPVLGFSIFDESKTDIYFANGILTKETDAKYNTEEILKPAIKYIYNGDIKEYKKHIGKVGYSYNSTYDSYFVQGGPDLMESLYQKMGIHDILDSISLLFNNMEESVHSADLFKQVLEYRTSIVMGRRVLVVAHSQGNLFTYDAYQALEDESKNGWMQEYFKVVSIASPQMTRIKDDTPLVSWDNDVVARLGIYNSEVVYSPIRKIYWEDLYPDNTSVTDIKPTSNYIKDDQIGSIYKDKWVALESLIGVNDKVHAFTFYMGLPLKDKNNINIINPIDGNFLQSDNARIAILNDIKYQLDKLEALPSQWIYDTNSSDKKVFLKHRFDEDINTFTEEVYPFNMKDGKVYSLESGQYVKASYGGKEILDNWEDKKDNEIYKLDNPQEEIIVSDRFISSETNETIIDTKYYLIWDNQDKEISEIWKDANNYCKTLTLDSYEKWSLPTLFELQSIVNPTSDNNLYEEFTKLSSNPYGYWSDHHFFGYNQFMPWLGLQEQASVFMYENNRVSEHSTSYEMNVMCVQWMY
ncbi:MAG: DUF1566 domain-containing protein, partial [Sulfurovum sp.]|nr:DUF1566 domain-containing protein [Sulfurovaceae bacterium]